MTRKSVILSIIFLLAISAVAFLVAYTGNNQLKSTITAQFNEQQLTLAGKTAKDIETHFAFLETFLTIYAHDCLQRPSESGSSGFCGMYQSWQVLGAGIITRTNGSFRAVPEPGCRSLTQLGLEFPVDRFQELTDSRQSRTFYSRTIIPETGPYRGDGLMFMARSLARAESGAAIPDQTSSDHPAGVYFLVNATELAKRHCVSVISGKTGYPWIVDSSQRFLYHHEQDFIGQDFRQARQEKNPDISYQRVNRLLETKLLKGTEGTDWYISGWHRQKQGKIKKLAAWSPVFFPGAGQEEPVLWSVVIAAPESEVYGLIFPVLVKQWTVAGLFIIVVVTGLLGLYLASLSWNRALASKVREKTAHLTESRELLQKEKEKVEKSMQALMETQQKLIHSERFAAIGEAASHMSHEIKNPLMLMSGFAKQVSRSLPQDDPNQNKLEMISREALRLEKMLNQVRDFTRPQLPSKETGQINDIIRETFELVSEELDLSKIQCVLDLNPELPEARFDKSQLKQVLINLFKNAWEAMPEGGIITISTDYNSERIRVTVQDSGSGIPPDKIKKIFSPFYTTKDKGTGLGLAVTYRIIQDHKGEVTISSQPGQGSSFTFYLPRS